MCIRDSRFTDRHSEFSMQATLHSSSSTSVRIAITFEWFSLWLRKEAKFAKCKTPSARRILPLYFVESACPIVKTGKRKNDFKRMKCNEPIASSGDKALRWLYHQFASQILVDLITTCRSFFFYARNYQTEAADSVKVIDSFSMKKRHNE